MTLPWHRWEVVAFVLVLGRAGFHWALVHTVQPCQQQLSPQPCVKLGSTKKTFCVIDITAGKSGLAWFIPAFIQRLTQKLLRYLWVTKALIQWHCRTLRNLLCAGSALRKLLMGFFVGKDVSSQSQWHNLNYSLQALGGCLWSFRGPEAVPGAAAKSRVIIEAFSLI